SALETTCSAICSLAPKVARACSSKSALAVSTTTCVLLLEFFCRPILMTPTQLDHPRAPQRPPLLDRRRRRCRVVLRRTGDRFGSERDLLLRHRAGDRAH